MGRDPVDRILQQFEYADKRQPFDPIFNPVSVVQSTATTRYDPNDVFGGKNFGKPATGDGS